MPNLARRLFSQSTPPEEWPQDRRSLIKADIANGMRPCVGVAIGVRANSFPMTHPASGVGAIDLQPEQIMSYRAVIHDLHTGRFLLRCDVQAHDLHEAENVAISKAALATKCHPGDMDVRHLHECAERAFVHATDTQPYSAYSMQGPLPA